MIDPAELIELLQTGAIETYRGELEALVDKSSGLVIISQGERMLVMDYTQAADLIRVMLFKIGEHVV